MTTVYFVRHAEADNTNRDGRNRPLTVKGLADRKLVTNFFQDKDIDAVLSIINHYDRTYGYDGFMAMVDILPWVAKMDFN